MTEDRKILLKEYANSFYAYSRLIEGDVLYPKKQKSVPSSQLALMYLLLGNSTMSTQEIAGQLNTTSSAVTQLVDSLEQSGLVLRTTGDQDRRRVDIGLSGDGVREAMSCQEALISRLDKFFESVSDEALVEVIELQHNIIYTNKEKSSKLSGK
jgi:DNA-binding MarR family transcriptional regulator